MMENYKQNYIHKPYLFLAILFSLLSCQKEVVSKVTFERKLSGIKSETEFRLDSLRNDKWQKCYIIPPYQQYNSALNRIKLRKHDLNKIKENAISDGINTFVFINNDGSISIETVSRSIIDIQDTLLDSIFLFYPTTIMKMDSKRKIIDIK